jgi:hypothetical protein
MIRGFFPSFKKCRRENGGGGGWVGENLWVERIDMKRVVRRRELVHGKDR